MLRVGVSGFWGLGCGVGVRFSLEFRAYGVGLGKGFRIFRFLGFT